MENQQEQQKDNWLNDKEARAWRGYIAAVDLLAAQIERDLQKDSGMSHADYAVLVSLSEIEGHKMRMTVLAERMTWSKSRLSHQVARMESRGLVQRAGCGDDARGSYLVLTDKGLETIETAAPAHVASVRRHLLDNITEEQIETLGDITAAIIEHLRSIGAAPESCPSMVQKVQASEQN